MSEDEPAKVPQTPAGEGEGEVAVEDGVGFEDSERTIPDFDLDLDVDAVKPKPSEVPAEAEAEAEVEAEAEAEAPAPGVEAPAKPAEAPRSTIPAPALNGPARPAPASESGWQPDGLGIAAIIVFVLVGAVLVFNFARTLVPAAEAQLGAACRPLAPEPRTGPAPAIELEDLEGNPVSLADYAGKFLVVNFWATWCEPCTREWPDLDTLAYRMGERDDVAVLAISVDQELADIGPYLERMGLSQTSVEILRAKDPSAHETFGSEKIPDTYFVDEAGQLEAVFVNVRKWGRAKGVRCVEASIEH